MERFITGEPYYQIYKNFDYWLKFNNQNSSEEKNVKLLLCLPMIPQQYHGKIRLFNKKLGKQSQKANGSPMRGINSELM